MSRSCSSCSCCSDLLLFLGPKLDSILLLAAFVISVLWPSGQHRHFFAHLLIKRKATHDIGHAANCEIHIEAEFVSPKTYRNVEKTRLERDIKHRSLHIDLGQCVSASFITLESDPIRSDQFVGCDFHLSGSM